MTQIEPRLRALLADALKACFGIDLAAEQIGLQITRKDFEGDRTLVTFPFTKAAGKGPEQIGQVIGDWLVTNSDGLIVRYNVVKGFLNLVIADWFWVQSAAELMQAENLAQLPRTGQKVLVEYSSPNTNKPLHLGHLRNNFLGYAVSEILKAAGNEVITANLINDRGIHICKSMLAYQKFGNGMTPESSGMKGDKLVGHFYVVFNDELKQQVKNLIKGGMKEDEAAKSAPILHEAAKMLEAWEAGDPEVIALWNLMNSWVYAGFEATYKSIGVSFDKYYYESNTYLLGKDIVEEGLAKGVFYQKEDSSVWIDLTEEGLDQKIVRRSNGTSVYITQDMGTADLKFEEVGASKSIYVVGNEQDYHFKVLFKTLQKLGRPYSEGLFHLSYGMVELPAGKMKSRDGTVVDADDLIDLMVDTAAERTRELGKINEFDSAEAQALYHMLGVGAIKYFLLKVEPQKKMLFNPSESIDMQGNTATFIQYTHARIRSIARKGQELYGDLNGLHVSSPLAAEERELVVLLNELPGKIAEAARDYAPSVIANYTYEVAKTYNSFFAACPIFKADQEDTIKFRVALSALTGRVIKECFGLLGISVPERM